MNFLDIKDIERAVLALGRVSSQSSDLAIGFDHSFESIRVGNFEIGINAGPSLYCHPAEKLDNLGQYQAVQIIILEYLSETQAILIPGGDERFNYFDWTKYFIYQGHYNKTRNSYIGSMVPLTVLYQIIKDLYKVGRLKTFF